MPNYELELTNKGRRAIETMDIKIPAKMPSGYQHTLLHVLVMVQNGMDEEERIEEYIRTTVIESGEAVTPSLARFMLDAVVKLLVVTRHLKYSDDDEQDEVIEEPPEAFKDFKDLF